jgi:hypothetical protein
VAVVALCLALAVGINYGISRAIVWALREGFGVHAPVLPVCALLFVFMLVCNLIARAAKQ